MIKNLRPISVVIAIIGLILIFTLGSLAVPWGDDFCGLSGLKEFTLVEYALIAYKNWDGRFLTYYMIALFLKSPYPWPLAIFLWITCFLISVKAVQKFTFRKEHQCDVFLYFVLAAIFWIGMRRYISETVYWISGGGYTFAAFVGITWMFTYDKLKLDRIWKIILWAIFSIIAGIGSYSLSPAIITFIVYPKLAQAFKTRKVLPVLKDKEFILSFLFVLIGTSILVAAPGNYVRSTHAEDAFTGFIPWTYLLTIFKFTNFGWPLILLILIFGVLIKDKIKEVSLHEKVRWLLVAIATASPFALLNSFTSPRTSIFFHFFISIFIILCLRSVKISIAPKIQAIILAVISLVFYVMIIGDLIKAIPFYKEYSSQIASMEKKRASNEDLVFERRHSQPRSMRINDLSDDPKNWANLCSAKYYEVKSISIKKIP